MRWAEKLMVSVVVLASITGYVGTANASLIGDTIGGELLFGGSGSTNYFLPSNGSVPTGACQDADANSVVFVPNPSCGREFQYEDGFSTIEVGVGGETLAIIQGFSSSGPASSWEINLTDLDWLPNPGIITGIVETLDEFTGDGVSASFGPDSLSFSWGGGDVSQQFYRAFYTIETEHIPAPATLALMGLGVAGIGFQRRKKIKAA